MFKLVAVGGRARGTEYTLEPGENILGRAQDADHVINVDGVSKKHMRITVNKDSAFLEDLGSSNGTFVNGKLTRKITLKDKDQIALPNIIFKVVYVKEKKIIVKKKVAKIETDLDAIDTDTAPDNLLGKIIYLFKNKVMSIVYDFNKVYEWKHLLGIFLALMTIGNLFLTVTPVLLKVQDLLYEEVLIRAEQYADEVATKNSIHLKRGDTTRVDTSFLDNQEGRGVMSYALFDPNGNMIRPIGEGEKIRDGFAIEAAQYFKRQSYPTTAYFNKSIDNNQIGVAKVIFAQNINTARNEPVGIISIHFKPGAISEFEIFNKTIYWKTFIYTMMLAVLFFGIIYFMTLKPIREVKLQADEVLRGKRKDISSDFLFEELFSLKDTLNTVIQKNRELMNEDMGDFAEIEDDGSYVSIFHEIMLGSDHAVLILNSEKNVQHVNDLAGDLTGMRESLVKGSNILDVAQNQGIAGTILKLCDDSANNNGMHQQDFYELEGESYMINTTSLIGKDGFAKAFYITFIKEM